MFIIQYSFSLLLLVLAFAGCTAPRRVTGGEVDHDPVLRMLEASYASTQDLTVEGNLKISGVPVTVWFDAFVRSRDSMKIVLTGPFGMSVGAMSATPEYFLFFNPELGEAVEGRPDRQTFQQLILIGLDYNEMISLLRGEIPRVPAAGEYTAAVEEDGIRYIVERAGQREEFLVDPEGPVVTSYRRSMVRPDTTIVELDILYETMFSVGARRLPRNVTVDVAGGAQRIRVAVEKVAPSIDAEESLMITIPGGIPRRRI